MKANEIVIVGGHGKTGGRVFGRLKARGENVRVASRSTTPALDWADRQSLALSLVERVRQIFGRGATDLVDYMSETAATGIWSK